METAEVPGWFKRKGRQPVPLRSSKPGPAEDTGSGPSHVPAPAFPPRPPAATGALTFPRPRPLPRDRACAKHGGG